MTTTKSKFQLLPLDFSEIADLGIAISRYYQNRLQIKNEQSFHSDMYSVYRSQRELNEEISAFNFNQRLNEVTRAASSVRVAFARSGLSGGTAEDDIQRYQRDLVISAFNS